MKNISRWTSFKGVKYWGKLMRRSLKSCVPLQCLLCFPCYLKYEASKKEKKAEMFVCKNNGYGGCGAEKHDPKELEAIDAMSVREYMRDKYRRDRTNFNEEGVFCLPLRCSGCGKWWVVDRNKVL